MFTTTVLETEKISILDKVVDQQATYKFMSFIVSTTYNGLPKYLL